MKRCTIGGQAVLEGVMMKSPDGIALAVRKSDGEIVTEFQNFESKAKKGSVWGWPVIRGVVVFVESLVTGMKTTTRSAELFGEAFETEEPTRFERWLSKVLGKSVMDVAIGIAVILAILLAVGLFVYLPLQISKLIPWGNVVWIVPNVAEGLIRLLIFLGYLFGISLLKDVKRLYMYHGAEHKTIACYENEEALTPENVKKYTRRHPRCGTNYLFLVMAVAILMQAFLPPVSTSLPAVSAFLLKFVMRLAFIPLVAGISYEVLRLAATSDNLLCRIVRAPGMGLQRLTTREPDMKMLEVAIAAFNLAMGGGEIINNNEEIRDDGPPSDT